MPYTPGNFDAAHLYLQWGGKLPGGDQWSCGLRLQTPAGGPADGGAALGVLIAPAIQTFHGSSGAQISARALLSFVKCNLIDVTGHYAGSGTNQVVIADDGGGGSGTNHPPNQIAIAVSLETGFSRGPAHAGRVYIPMPMYPIDNVGLISGGDATSMGTAFDALITAINGHGTTTTPQTRVAVFSRKSGAAAHRVVTGVRVGRVLDTQRRRRNSLSELYV